METGVLGMLGSEAPTPDEPRDRPEDVPTALRAALAEGELDLPLPGQGETTRRWSHLAGFGRRDLAMARLVEGHTDAVAILYEAGEKPVPHTLYGVWASRAAGQGARLLCGDSGSVLTGTVPFCSGVGELDRALIAARPEGAQGAEDDLLVDLPLAGSGIRPLPDTWWAAGMAASRTQDVELGEVPVGEDEHVGPGGFYTHRPGFPLGGAGVAAVWLGGAAGVVDRVFDHLVQRRPDEHQLAHVAAMHLALTAADSTLTRSAAVVDASEPVAEPVDIAATCRSMAERTACEVLSRAPRTTGPGPLSRDAVFAQRMADLEVYVRQHHGERDLAALGRRLLHEGVNGVTR